MATSTRSTKAGNGNGTSKSTADDVEAANAAVAEQLQTLRKDVADLTARLTDLGAVYKDQAVGRAEETREYLKGRAADTAEHARERADDLMHQTENFIKTQPATALGIAAGIGFLVGLLTSRR